MAAATVTFRSETALAEEVVLLECSDGETFKTRLSEIKAVTATNNTASGSCITLASWSGLTVTVANKQSTSGSTAGPADQAISLIIKGYV